jgi:hypothetical protein
MIMPPQEAKTGLFFRLTYEQKGVLDKVAKNEERTLQSVFNRAMREYILKYHNLNYMPIENELAALDNAD